MRWYDFAAIVVLLALVFGVSGYLNNKITGKNIAPNYNSNNYVCDENFVLNFWKKYINVGGKVNIIWEKEKNCEEGFVSYKVDGNKFWYIVKEKDYGYGFYEVGGEKMRYASKEVIKVGFFEFDSKKYVEYIEKQKNYDDFLKVLAGMDDGYLKEWDISSKSEAENKLKEFFKNYPDDSLKDYFPGYFVGNSSESVKGVGNLTRIKTIKFVSKVQAETGFGYLKYFYEKTKGFNLIKKIPNMKFKSTGKWKYGFYLGDYFDNLNKSMNFDVVCVGICDERINYSIVGQNVLFKNKNNFTGYRKFMVIESDGVDKIYSNKFWVGFYDKLNRAPVQIYKIDDFNLTKGEKIKIPLGEFFKDPENDSLNYDVYGSKSLDFFVDSGNLYVSFKEGFENDSWFYVNVSDGEFVITSNKVFVGYVREKTKKVLQNVGKGNKTLDNKNKGNESVKQEINYEEIDKYKIFAVIGIIVIVLEIISVIIYFGVIKKKKKQKVLGDFYRRRVTPTPGVEPGRP